jgi:hypothetical protein
VTLEDLFLSLTEGDVADPSTADREALPAAP